MARILRSQFNFFRVFDIGSEINLDLASKILEGEVAPTPFTLKRSTLSVIIQGVPLRMSLGTWEHTLHGHTFLIEGVGKLWTYGALSLNLKIHCEIPFTINEYFELAKKIEADDDLHQLCLQKATSILETIKASVSKPGIWPQYEDYLILRPQELDLQGETLQQLIDSDSFASMVLLERAEKISEQMREMLFKSFYQYGENDFVLIHWNAAVIYDTLDAQDIADVIEFALCQLLEMRYYDQRLDVELNDLYDSLEAKAGMFRPSKYTQFSHKAAVTYLEINDITEKVENSLKVIGDFYYAQIFRVAVEKFRLRDWENSIDKKLTNLAEISKLFQGEIHEQRNFWLEFVILILIAVEVLPIILKYVL